MIETLEEYQSIMRSTHNMIAGSIELEATFMALCKAARAAQKHRDDNWQFVGRKGHGTWVAVWRALDDLPKWLLEGEEKDPGYFFSGPADLQGIPLNNPDTESEEGKNNLSIIMCNTCFEGSVLTTPHPNSSWKRECGPCRKSREGHLLRYNRLERVENKVDKILEALGIEAVDLP